MERYFVVKKSSALRVSSETKTSDSKTTTKTKTKRYQPYANARREHASSSSNSGSSTSTRTTREVSSLSPTPTHHDDNHDYDNNDDHNDHDIDNTNTNVNTNVNADMTDLKNLSTKDLTHLVLSTLSHRSNPITHSDIYERTEHIVSAASGHQRGDGRVNGGHKAWFDHRSSKLNEQRNAEAMRTASSSASTSSTSTLSSTTSTATSTSNSNNSNTNANGDTNANANANGNSKASVLKGVRVYINGYLRNTTDIEMKRIVIGAGGSILLTPSGATHILTSQQLSGSKTHKILTAKNSKRAGHVQVHVVRPEWVVDSIEAGRKMREVDYAVVRDGRMRRIEDMFGKRM